MCAGIFARTSFISRVQRISLWIISKSSTRWNKNERCRFSLRLEGILIKILQIVFISFFFFENTQRKQRARPTLPTPHISDVPRSIRGFYVTCVKTFDSDLGRREIWTLIKIPICTRTFVEKKTLKRESLVRMEKYYRIVFICIFFFCF